MGLQALLLLVTAVSAGRHYLSKNRIPEWKALNDVNHGPSYPQPEQVHLSYGGDPSIMLVTWMTFDDTIEAVVEYGTALRSLNLTTKGRVSLFSDDDGKEKPIKRYVSRVRLTGLVPGTAYYYHVGSDHGWSPIFSFTALKPRPDGGYIYAFYGDMGNENARSLGSLQKGAQSGAFDVVLHVGDFAYDMNEHNGKTGDEFNRQIEPISAYVPYMTVVGNHENHNNFSQYTNRYTMPGTDDNHFYSFDIDKVHFIGFSTEFYFYTNYGYDQIGRQFNWLIEDLEKASKNRHNVPWIITMAHRPMYCSDYDGDDCTKYESIIRNGMPDTHAYGLEKLFHSYGVDVMLWAHEHSYERMYPLYNRTVFNGTHSPYVDPPAPVHIVTGAAGCRENTDTFIEHPPPWSAIRSSNYGYSTMHVYNGTHIHIQQLAVGTGTIEDDFWVIKTSHGRYDKRDKDRLKRYGTRIPKNYCHHPSHCAPKKKPTKDDSLL